MNFAASLGTETADGAPTTYSTKDKYEYLKPSIEVSHDSFFAINILLSSVSALTNFILPFKQNMVFIELLLLL